MIKVNNSQQLIQYKELTDMTIDEHIKTINATTKEAAVIYIYKCITNNELLKIQNRINEIKEELKEIINKIANEYLIRMNTLQYAHDNNKMEEYLENINILEIIDHISDFKKEDVELTEQGVEVAKTLNKIIESINSSIEPIKLPQKKK